MIGSRIKELRNNQKLTQEQLSDGIVSRTYLSLIEKGTVRPSNNVLVMLSKRLGVNVNDLMVESKDYQYSDIDLSREIIFYEDKINKNEYDAIELFIEKQLDETEDIQQIDLARIYLIYSAYYLHDLKYKQCKDYLIRASHILLNMPVNDYYIRYVKLMTEIYLKEDNINDALTLIEQAVHELIISNRFKLETIQLLFKASEIYFEKSQYFTVLRIIRTIESNCQQLNIEYEKDNLRYMKGMSLYFEKEYDELERLTKNESEIFDKVLYTYVLLVKGDVKTAQHVYTSITPTREYEALNKIIDELNERFSSII